MLAIDPQSPAAPPAGALERRRYTVRGLVQGVGFRPFVHRLATRLNLAGQVRNDAHGVCIEVEGRATSLDAFAQALRTEAPAGARQRAGPGSIHRNTPTMLFVSVVVPGTILETIECFMNTLLPIPAA